MKVRDLLKTSRLSMSLAEKLIGDLLKISKEGLFLQKNKIPLSSSQVRKFRKIEKVICEKRLPYQYAVEKAEFYGREFIVNKNVLIPRPETETMVKEAIKFTKNRNGLTVIDIGTGSGCVAISLAKENPRLDLFAVDISRKALNIAIKNAKIHKTRIKFLRSDLLSNNKLPRKFDLILANLPYGNPRDENYKKVADPRVAIEGGKDGLDLIKRLIIELPDRLADNGLAILEIDPRQKNKIANLARRSNLKIDFQKDLNERVRLARLA